ncbi:hypothetical protein RHGRI_008060 [Rhododendron griersonianum]|uniref:3-deoxy-8-phosphooctulonate synthase n=1 Tax=Rhododendron griersonianum TaxID=479676 RepID=A0AAV6L171_9ERIC|nr:hypothetical protein RHGRI_008060 [Rhododendron griersonianum]
MAAGCGHQPHPFSLSRDKAKFFKCTGDGFFVDSAFQPTQGLSTSALVFISLAYLREERELNAMVLIYLYQSSEPFFLMAGPNVIESEEHVMRMANHIKAITSKYALSLSLSARTPSIQCFLIGKQVNLLLFFVLMAVGIYIVEGDSRPNREFDFCSFRLGLQLVFKSSFDKANRTSSKSFRGPGLVEGLKILEKVKVAYDIPIVTDVHESIQCEAVGRVADIIQIPAFLCRQVVLLAIVNKSLSIYVAHDLFKLQTDLLVAAAKTGKIVNIKKGQFCAPSVMANSAEKIRLAGNENVMVCERGTMFGYNDLIVDPRNFEWMREANCPVVADVTHSLQQPAGRKLEGGGVASGGLRELIPCISRTAVAVGVDGIFMEVC